MKKINFLLVFTSLLALSVLSVGCRIVSYKSPTGEKLLTASCGNKTSIRDLDISGETNGVRTLHLQGYVNDQAQVAGSVTEAAVRAAITSTTGRK